jgi:hypothetical protein
MAHPFVRVLRGPKMSEIRQAMRTFPSSGRSMSTLMLELMVVMWSSKFLF